jgi:transcriptional regulator with XRE-family HTH domain
MEPFFVEVERLGITQRRLAALMGISEAHFSKVKSGIVPVTPKFRRKAIIAFELLHVRRANGEALTEADLFLAGTDSEQSTVDSTRVLSEVA